MCIRIVALYGFTIALMALADYLTGRKKQKQAIKCDVCGEKFESIEKMESHRREVHSDKAPETKHYES